MISGISNGGILSLFFHVLIEGIIATFACIKERNEKPQKQLPSAECNQKLLHLLKYGGSKQLITVPRKNAAVAAWFKLRDKDAENYLFEHVGERTWSKVLDAHTKEKLRKVFKKGLNEANGVRGIRDNLLKVFPELNPDQAKMIASTKMASAENYGLCKTYLDCGINSVLVIEVEGCSVCIAVRGMIISTKLAICHLLQHAGCRRKFLPMFPGEYSEDELDDEAFLAAVGQPEYEKAEDGRSIFKIERHNYTIIEITADTLPKASPQLTYPDRCNSGYSPRNFTQSTDCRERSFNGRSFFAQDSEG